MYDDLLGPRKREAPKPELDIGSCGQCRFAKRSPTQRRSETLYCTDIKKYIHKRQQSCLRFRRRVYENKKVELAKS